MYVLHEPSDVSFEKVGIQGKIFPSRPLADNAGFALITTQSGHETTIIEHESNFVYYVLEGSGFFEVDGRKEDCAAGDLVVIPMGKKFTYKGKLIMLLVSTPPWREEQEETL
jgi:mannose-6-phosphate isomerase-like protein (cupin superfamily)